jgi:negative regulator of flagellin synthesis FlgM
MSISPINSQSMTVRALAALRANAAPVSAQSATRQPDSISLSDSARAMSTALSAVSDAADVREDRVSALKQAIANGTYSIDSRSLANDMLSAGALG